jgi:hypothetical protein
MQNTLSMKDLDQQKSKIVDLGSGKAKEDNRKADLTKYGEFVDVVCYNCGTPGHHKANCKKPKMCFICKKESHEVEVCPIK